VPYILNNKTPSLVSTRLVPSFLDNLHRHVSWTMASIALLYQCHFNMYTIPVHQWPCTIQSTKYKSNYHVNQQTKLLVRIRKWLREIPWTNFSAWL